MSEICRHISDRRRKESSLGMRKSAQVFQFSTDGLSRSGHQPVANSVLDTQPDFARRFAASFRLGRRDARGHAKSVAPKHRIPIEREARRFERYLMSGSRRAFAKRHLAPLDEDPDCLLRRRSRFENGHTPLHAAFASPDGLGFLAGRPDYAMMELLIELGDDVEATDDKARTPLAVAMLRGDHEAIRMLRAAGAKEPPAAPQAQADSREEMIAAAKSVKKISPMFAVRDMRATVRWYESIGFSLQDEYEDSGELVFARLTFGSGEFALGPGGNPGPRDVTLWFFTNRVQELYEVLKGRQLRAARRISSGAAGEFEVRFEEDLYSPFYGGRQFSIRDNNGLTLIFWQPEWLSPSTDSTAQS